MTNQDAPGPDAPAQSDVRRTWAFVRGDGRVSGTTHDPERAAFVSDTFAQESDGERVIEMVPIVSNGAIGTVREIDGRPHILIAPDKWYDLTPPADVVLLRQDINTYKAEIQKLWIERDALRKKLRNFEKPLRERLDQERRENKSLRIRLGVHKELAKLSCKNKKLEDTVKMLKAALFDVCKHTKENKSDV